jgi:hypothetical protein
MCQEGLLPQAVRACCFPQPAEPEQKLLEYPVAAALVLSKLMYELQQDLDSICAIEFSVNRTKMASHRRTAETELKRNLAIGKTARK